KARASRMVVRSGLISSLQANRWNDRVNGGSLRRPIGEEYDTGGRRGRRGNGIGSRAHDVGAQHAAPLRSGPPARPCATGGKRSTRPGHDSVVERAAWVENHEVGPQGPLRGGGEFPAQEPPTEPLLSCIRNVVVRDGARHADHVGRDERGHAISQHPPYRLAGARFILGHRTLLVRGGETVQRDAPGRPNTLIVAVNDIGSLQTPNGLFARSTSPIRETHRSAPGRISRVVV